VPADWIKVIASAKKHKAFVVTELKTAKIVSLKPLEQRAVNRKKTPDGHTVEWLKCIGSTLIVITPT